MLSNLVSKLRNAQIAHRKSVKFRDIGFCTRILDILWDHGLIRGYTKPNNGEILIFLLYLEGVPLIKNSCVLSKSTRRIYVSSREVFSLSKSGGVLIVSTARGILSADQAYRSGVGGEVLAYFE